MLKIRYKRVTYTQSFFNQRYATPFFTLYQKNPRGEIIIIDEKEDPSWIQASWGKV